jgi:hypothetical protein
MIIFTGVFPWFNFLLSDLKAVAGYQGSRDQLNSISSKYYHNGGDANRSSISLILRITSNNTKVRNYVPGNENYLLINDCSDEKQQ